VSASSDREVIMRLETDLDIGAPSLGAARRCSTPADRYPANVRNNVGDRTLAAGESLPPPGSAASWEARAASRAGAGAAAAAAPAEACTLSVPHGWWTSDGLGLIRRCPAGVDTPASDIQTHYYPSQHADPRGGQSAEQRCRRRPARCGMADALLCAAGGHDRAAAPRRACGSR